MTDVTIRQAIPADVPGVVALLDEVDDLHRKALPWLLRAVDEPRPADFLEEFICRPDRAMLLAATTDQPLAGALLAYLREPSRTPIVRPIITAEIDTLVVGHSSRRRGVATRLVQAALEWAADNGATRTELGVYEFNEQARAFWASVGFQTLSRRLVSPRER